MVNLKSEFDEYKFYLGETIVFYQLVEYDLKVILAAMMSGKIEDNINYIESSLKGMGQIIVELEKLDNSTSKPYFDKQTYMLLQKTARCRNYYCHKCAVDFAFIANSLESNKFKQEFLTLKKVNEDLKYIQNQTTIFRIESLKKYKH